VIHSPVVPVFSCCYSLSTFLHINPSCRFLPHVVCIPLAAAAGDLFDSELKYRLPHLGDVSSPLSLLFAFVSTYCTGVLQPTGAKVGPACLAASEVERSWTYWRRLRMAEGRIDLASQRNRGDEKMQLVSSHPTRSKACRNHSAVGPSGESSADIFTISISNLH
jgi:hypothetical protein